MYSKTTDQHKFVTLRRSRKGTNLNIPEEFNRVHKEQTSITRVEVLPRAGCCDLDYVLFRKNAHAHDLVSRQEQTLYDNYLPAYPSSVAINTGSPPFTQKQVYQSYRRHRSYSTLSINPTVVSEEPWIPRKNVVPLGLYCCGNKPICEHTQSREQGMINLDVSKANIDDNKYAYITVAPKISPLKSFWNFLTCKKKKYQGEPYNPAVMTKRKIPLECANCPKDAQRAGRHSLLKKHISFSPSRLSTITESDGTISEFSSEEFDPNGPQQKPKKAVLGSRESNGTDRELRLLDIKMKNAEPTDIVLNPNSTKGHPTYFYPDGDIHRWVCKPSGDHGRRGGQYLCYLKR